jgi:hypothetical protein
MGPFIASSAFPFDFGVTGGNSWNDAGSRSTETKQQHLSPIEQTKSLPSIPITAPLNRQLRVVRAQRGVCEKKR